VANRRRPLGIIITTTIAILMVARVILAANNQMDPPVDSLVNLAALRPWSVALWVMWVIIAANMGTITSVIIRFVRS
jgi:hypothetical protein